MTKKSFAFNRIDIFGNRTILDQNRKYFVDKKA